MATTVTIAGSVAAREINEPEFSKTSSLSVIDFAATLANGTGLDQCDIVCGSQRTSSGSGLDLFGALMTDVTGTSHPIDILKLFIVKNLNTAAGDVLEMIGEGANAFLTYDIQPGGVFFLFSPSLAGTPVVSGGGTNITFNAGGVNDIEYEVLVAGIKA